jgi:hypothetical protein
MRDPIEGKFRVIGEKPPRETILKTPLDTSLGGLARLVLLAVYWIVTIWAVHTGATWVANTLAPMPEPQATAQSDR